MFCSKCGGQLADSAAFCPTCGQPTGAQAPAPRGIPLAPGGFTPATGAYPPPPPAPPTTSASGYAPAALTRVVVYAGFWLRFVAWLIDIILLDFVLGIVVVIPIMGSSMGNIEPGNFFEMLRVLGPKVQELQLITLAVAWLYYALMESSAWQATLGKKALGLEVIDLNGRRVTFGRATGRFFGKIISFPFTAGIGYIMAGFTARKQALHDMMASCLVIRKL
ncbi:MAG TPA: RDD family protein [Candidatus Acidoferrales bacterium]|nr:RDD family protein [Candidatus Acidoferrales bacterium]